MPGPDLEPVALILLIVAAFSAGWVDAVVGGGGLIQLPALLIALPPTTSPATILGTNKVSSVWGTATSSITYAAKITNDEARIEWPRPAREVHNRVRGLSPFPGAFFTADLGKGPERVKVRRTTLAVGSGPPGTLVDEAGTVACGEGAVHLLTVQRAGKGPLPAPEFLRGARLEPGARLA